MARQRVAEEHECTCGLPHDQVSRRRILSRLLPATAKEVRGLFPCLWEREGEAARMLFRDLQALGAVRVGGEWVLPAKARS